MKKQWTDQEITSNNPCKSALITCHEQSRMGGFVLSNLIFGGKTKFYQTNPFSYLTRCPVIDYLLQQTSHQSILLAGFWELKSGKI